MLRPDQEADLYIDQSCQSAPDHHVARRRITGTCEIAALITGRSPQGTRLRKSGPFSVLFGPDERDEIFDKFKGPEPVQTSQR